LRFSLADLFMTLLPFIVKSARFLAAVAFEWTQVEWTQVEWTQASHHCCDCDGDDDELHIQR
jgi:hypothetical protein